MVYTGGLDVGVWVFFVFFVVDLPGVRGVEVSSTRGEGLCAAGTVARERPA